MKKIFYTIVSEEMVWLQYYDEFRNKHFKELLGREARESLKDSKPLTKMKEIINTLEMAIRQFWPEAVMLRRYKYRIGEPASYWFFLKPGLMDLIRVFPNRDNTSFYLSCFRCSDTDTVEKFTFDLERFGNDMMMLPYSTQNLEVLFTGEEFLIRKVGTISKHDTLLPANSIQLIAYAANGFS